MEVTGHIEIPMSQRVTKGTKKGWLKGKKGKIPQKVVNVMKSRELSIFLKMYQHNAVSTYQPQIKKKNGGGHTLSILLVFW